MEQRELGLLDYLAILLKYSRFIVVFTLTVCIVTYVLSKLAPPQYQATTKFVANKEASQRSLTEIVGLSSGQDPSLFNREVNEYYTQLYAELLRSQLFMDKLLAHEFTVENKQSVKLIDLIHAKGSSEAERYEDALKRLRYKVLDIIPSNQTGIITLSAETRDRAVSADICNFLVEELQSFERARKTADLSAMRVKAEQRTGEQEKDLDAAEDKVRDFQEKNRRIVTPEAEQQLKVLERDAELKKELFITLKTESEKLKLAEDASAQVITVIEKAIPPYKKSRPVARINVAVAGLFSLVMAFIIAFFRNSLEQLRLSNDPSYWNFREGLRQFFSYLKPFGAKVSDAQAKREATTPEETLTHKSN
ncbi:MAG: GNVR domain-containing protein [bacterium]